MGNLPFEGRFPGGYFIKKNGATPRRRGGSHPFFATAVQGRANRPLDWGFCHLGTPSKTNQMGKEFGKAGASFSC